MNAIAPIRFDDLDRAVTDAESDLKEVRHLDKRLSDLAADVENATGIVGNVKACAELRDLLAALLDARTDYLTNGALHVAEAAHAEAEGALNYQSERQEGAAYRASVL